MIGVAVIGAGMWAPRLVAAADRAELDVATCFARDREKAARGVAAFEPRDMLAEELREWALATRGEAVVETGAAEGMAALRVILEAVG